MSVESQSHPHSQHQQFINHSQNHSLKSLKKSMFGLIKGKNKNKDKNKKNQNNQHQQSQQQRLKPVPISIGTKKNNAYQGIASVSSHSVKIKYKFLFV